MEIFSLLFGGLTGLIGKAVNGYTSYKMKKLEYKHKETMIVKESRAMILEAKAQSQLATTIYEGKENVEEAKAFKLSIQQKDRISSYAYKGIDRLLTMKGNIRHLTVPIGIFLLTITVMIDNFRVSMRPGLTAFYTGVLFYITYNYLKYIDLHAQSIITNNPHIQVEILRIVINSILYITGTCVTWWFADRDFKRTLTRMLNKK